MFIINSWKENEKLLEQNLTIYFKIYTHFFSLNFHSRFLFGVYVSLSLNPTQYVNPSEGASSHIDHPESWSNQKEVHGLSWKPKHTRSDKCRNKFFYQLFKWLFSSAFHQRHPWNESDIIVWFQIQSNSPV